MRYRSSGSLRAILAAPARHKMRVVPPSEDDGFLEGPLPVMANVSCAKFAPEIVSPNELREGPRLFRIASGFADRTRQRAERIVPEFSDLLGDRGVRLAIAVLVERMKQPLVVEEPPEMIGAELIEMGDGLDQDRLLPLILERPRKMVM